MRTESRLGGWGTLGWGTPRGKWRRTPGGFRGGARCQVREEKEEKRAIKRERRLAVAGERERGEQTQVH